MLRHAACRVVDGFSITIVGLVQLVIAYLNFGFSSPEWRSLTGAIALTFTSLGPLLASLYLIQWTETERHKLLFHRGLAVLVTLYSTLNCFLLLYRIERHLTFDFFFFWYNVADTYKTLIALDPRVAYVVLTILTLILLHCRGLLVLYKRLTARARQSANVAARPVRLILCCGVVGVLALAQVGFDNEFKYFVQNTLRSPPEATEIYAKYYEASIQRNKANTGDSPLIGENQNLFLIQLESLNAELVNETITPNLLRIAKRDGILFSRIQASSVMTVRAQESILCSLLPALKDNIAHSKRLTDGLVCLPHILKKHGVKALYFQSYPYFSFGNVAGFMKSIGFDELHSTDIMKPDDPLLPWGYHEDVFFKRVFAFLSSYRTQKFFAYVQVGPTNHYPFFNPEQRDPLLPFRQPRSFKEAIANTTYLQDRSFGEMYEKFYATTFGSNSNMIVFGDHSWPIEIHPGNRHNENGAFQENFVSSMAVFPARNARRRFDLNKRVERLYSQLDILPTILDMYGIKNLNYFGKSFMNELSRNSAPGPNRCLVSVQPFGGGYIALIKYPHKWILRLGDESVSKFDLSDDPNELSPVHRAKIDKDTLHLLDECMQSMGH